MNTLDVRVLGLLFGLFIGGCGDDNGVTPENPDPPDPPGPTIPRYEARPALATGAGHGCQLEGSSSLCWGSNSLGQFGNGTTSATPAYPTDPGWGLDLVLLTGGNTFTCGMTETGEGYCWGFNQEGLGVGRGTEVVTSPARIPASEPWSYIEALAANVCGVTESGEGYCWGRNGDGQVGDSTTVDRDEPSRVAGDRTWLMISPGPWHTCGVDVDGGLWCWGRNSQGQLGLGTTGEDIAWPTAVDTARAWASVSAGQGATCAIAVDGEAWCWGAEGLGDGSGGSSTTPVRVSGGHRWTALRSILGTCGVTIDGDAYCWGRAGSGQIGSGVVYDASADELVPRQVAGGHSWTSLAAPTLVAFCGETSTAEVFCWGRASPTQLVCSSPAWAPEPVLGSRAKADACPLRFARSDAPPYRVRTGVQSAPYADSLSAMGGGGGPYAWSLVAGDLPSGVTLVSRGDFGVLEGTPTETGRFDLRIRVAAANGETEEDVVLRVN